MGRIGFYLLLFSFYNLLLALTFASCHLAVPKKREKNMRWGLTVMLHRNFKHRFSEMFELKEIREVTFPCHVIAWDVYKRSKWAALKYVMLKWHHCHLLTWCNNDWNHLMDLKAFFPASLTIKEVTKGTQRSQKRLNRLLLKANCCVWDFFFFLFG